MSRRPPKPKYAIGQAIVGRTDHTGNNLPNQIVMIEVESARYDSIYGHWIYCGAVEHVGEFGTNVEMYEWDVIYKVEP